MHATTRRVALAMAAAIGLSAGPALAYDGTNCKEPGNCWEPKPGYPERVEGSEYDPQHDPAELNKQMESIAAMEERNATRLRHFKDTGEFVFDVNRIEEASAEGASPTPEGGTAN